MPIRPDSPLRKVTLNLYESDCQWFEENYGHGWTERIRQHINNEVAKRQQIDRGIKSIQDKFTMRRRTLGDLNDL